MPKDKPKPRASKPQSRDTSIAGLRTKIDRIDRELVAQMNQRAKLAHQIGKVKEANGQRAYDPVRECEVLARAVEHNHGPLANGCVQVVFR